MIGIILSSFLGGMVVAALIRLVRLWIVDR